MPYIRNTAVPFAVHNTAATAAEQQRAADFYAAVTADMAAFPCSFALDGAVQTGFANFELTGHTAAKDGPKTTDTFTLRHASGLACRVECAAYPEYAAFEWTVYFKNEGSQNSPKISQLCGADMLLPGKNAFLQGILGDARSEGFGNGDGVTSPTFGMNNQPYRVPLARGRSYELRPEGGCSCNREFPYFTVQTDAGAAMLAVGWPGQWKVTFHAAAEGVKFTAGQQILNAYLTPGEEIRTPLTCVLLADGDDEERQTNLWRRFMMDCNMPRQDGFISQPAIGGNSHMVTQLMTDADEESQLAQIRAFRQNGLRLDCWWMEAGWYTTDLAGSTPKVVDDYVFTGTWQMREKDFPTGMRAISDAMAETGGKTLLWFEPERSGQMPDTLKDDGSTLKKEWLLNHYEEYTRPREGGKNIPLPVTFVNLGNPEAWEWVKNRIFAIMHRGNIGIYREDFNIRPLQHWCKNDTPGRAGITENHYITGHLALWDAIRAEFGDMILDSCASGGRRNDLESMRRAVPMHYSDFFILDLEPTQAVHQSLFRYFPYFKFFAYQYPYNTYDLITALVPFVIPYADMTQLPQDQARVLQRYIAVWEQLNPYFYADYYPLLDWNMDDSRWLAYEFIDSQTGCGFFKAFRRPQCEQETCAIPLKGLAPDAQYKITRLLENECTVTLSGEALMTTGFSATLVGTPAAGLWKIEKVCG